MIRNTAAQQLADVQKQHPDELFNLLGRILPYLRSKSWDTRTAAAKAIGLIVSNADPYDPNEDDGLQIKSAAEHDDVEIKSEIKSEEPIPSDGLLKLDTLDIASVLKYGKRLLGSAGKEYEYSLASMEPAARLQHQKKTLSARLGLQGEYDDDELIEDIDIAPKVVTPAPKVVTPAPKREPEIAPISRQNSVHDLPSRRPSSPSEAAIKEDRRIEQATTQSTQTQEQAKCQDGS